MKIAMIHWGFPPIIGGVETHLIFLMPELVKMGHKVTLLTGAANGSPEQFDFKGAKIYRSKFYDLNWLFKSNFQDVDDNVLEVTVDYLDKVKPDIIHTHNMHYFSRYHINVVEHYAREHKIPLVLTAHNSWKDKLFLDLTCKIAWDKIIAINFKSVLYVCKAALPHMVKRGSGRVISIASDAGRVGSTGESVYAGTKGAIIAFSKTLAREMARYQITVNVVCPGLTETPLLEGIRQQSEKTARVIEAVTRAIPLGRVGQPEDIAGAVAFLASDDARQQRPGQEAGERLDRLHAERFGARGIRRTGQVETGPVEQIGHPAATSRHLLDLPKNVGGMQVHNQQATFFSLAIDDGSGKADHGPLRLLGLAAFDIQVERRDIDLPGLVR